MPKPVIVRKLNRFELLKRLLRDSVFRSCLVVFLSVYSAQSGQSALPRLSNAASGANPDMEKMIRSHVDPRFRPNNSEVAFETPFGQLDWTSLRTKIYEKNGNYYADVNNFVLELTLNPELTKRIQQTFNRERHIGAGLVMIDSASGALAAVAELGGENGNPLSMLENQITTARAPAASLMKIITSTAVIQENGFEPFDEIAFRGGCQHLSQRNWLRQTGSDRIKVTLAKAFATSCNTVFARLAIYHSGLAGLREYANRFQMNHPIPSDLLIETSLAALPQLETATTFDVGEAGAGFGFSKLSPVHSALLSASVANKGRMMAPYIVRRAFDKNGSLVYEAKPREIAQVMSETTADKMMVLMKATVTSGTSRSYFMRRTTRKHRAEIGGKTGTLRDMEDRSTLFTWFSGAGFTDEASASVANLAVGVVVASPINWLVRASSMAQYGFAEYYDLEEKAGGRIAHGQKND